MAFFIKRDDQINGPFTADQIKSGVASGKLKEKDLISNSKEGPWAPLAAAVGKTAAQAEEKVAVPSIPPLSPPDEEVVELAALEPRVTAANMSRQLPATGGQAVTAQVPVSTPGTTGVGGNPWKLPIIAGVAALLLTCVVVIGVQRLASKKPEKNQLAETAGKKENASPSEVKAEPASDDTEPVKNESPGDPFSNPDDPKEVFAVLRGEWKSSAGSRLYVQADRLTLVMNTEHGELAHIMEDITVDRMPDSPDSPNLRGVRLICSTVLLPALGNPDALTTIQTVNEKRIIACVFDNTKNLKEQDVVLQVADQRYYNDGSPAREQKQFMTRVALTPSPPSGSELKVLAEKWLLAKNRATASAKPPGLLPPELRSRKPSVETKPAPRLTRSEQAVLNYQLQGMRIGMSLTEFRRNFPKADFRFTTAGLRRAGIQKARVFDPSEVQNISGAVCEFYQGKLYSIVGQYTKINVTLARGYLGTLDDMVAMYGKPVKQSRGSNHIFAWDFSTVNRRLVVEFNTGDILKFMQIQVVDLETQQAAFAALE